MIFLSAYTKHENEYLSEKKSYEIYQVKKDKNRTKPNEKDYCSNPFSFNIFKPFSFRMISYRMEILLHSAGSEVLPGTAC